LVEQAQVSLADREVGWLVASEYAIVPVSHVTYPNRVLREAGLLAVQDVDGREELDRERSAAWALVDHQFSHVFVREGIPEMVERVAGLFAEEEGIAEVLASGARRKYGLDHERAGDVILVSEPESWQAYYWWLDDARAPEYARTVDIHRKPGYDPVELHFDFATKSIPLDATLIRGSHGAPVLSAEQEGVLVSSVKNPALSDKMCDRDVFEWVLRYFGVKTPD
jgi:hypothetical protein